MELKGMQKLSSPPVGIKENILCTVTNELHEETLNKQVYFSNSAHKPYQQTQNESLTTPGKIFLSLSTAANALDFPPERQSSNS